MDDSASSATSTPDDAGVPPITLPEEAAGESTVPAVARRSRRSRSTSAETAGGDAQSPGRPHFSDISLDGGPVGAGFFGEHAEYWEQFSVPVYFRLHWWPVLGPAVGGLYETLWMAAQRRVPLELEVLMRVHGFSSASQV